MRFGKLLKRTLLALLAAALLPPLAACVYGLVIGPLRNDRAANRLLGELLAELPPETEVVETAAWVGNSGGTGNHVEIWAGVLNRSGAGYPADEVRGCPWARKSLFGFPNTADPEALFPTLAATDSLEGYFICGRLAEAATQWDLRGS